LANSSDGFEAFEAFDSVVIATHSDQALRLLAAPSTQDRQVLGSIRYQPNRAVLHTDSSVLPSHPRAWAAWNYETQADAVNPNQQRVCLHYLLNKLQPLPVGLETPVVVSLNPLRQIDPSHIIQTFEYDHPVFDSAAIDAQQALPTIQGQGGVWFAGAWANYGFHEDGFQSGLAAASAVAQS
jgi:predicted NAD/FAD-binding protein